MIYKENKTNRIIRKRKCEGWNMAYFRVFSSINKSLGSTSTWKPQIDRWIDRFMGRKDRLVIMTGAIYIIDKHMIDTKYIGK